MNVGRLLRVSTRAPGCALTLFFLVTALSVPVHAANWTLVGWNNLGMHCTDGDFSLFSLLPPYNTFHAQLIDPNGNLVTSPTGITVTYEAVADPTGSINSTSQGKLNFWENAQSLFSLPSPLPADAGLAGKSMPGPTNTPQPMSWDPASSWFIAEGVPITPYDDGGNKNYYPLMRLVARDGAGQMLASTDIVLPVSDEMDCRSCHTSTSSDAAKPASGWLTDPDVQIEMRLNILRLHDERQAGDPLYASTLHDAGYDPAGLLATATATTNRKSILCANCHLSEALPGSGRAGVLPLTQAIHGLHAHVTDPVTGMTLDATENRAACYRCHPGSVTRCLRGAMGSAVAADGTLAMQCQSCHGSMSDVAAPTRIGWLNEPACQECHTGTAVNNNGQIRYTSVFDSSGNPRVAVNDTFATNPNTPAAPYNLYRFSADHGGVKCEGCHGSTHAEFPASHPNDNIQSIDHQGHVGMLAECTVCHATQPATVNGGPHGMHPIGSAWVQSHGGAAEQGGTGQCRACHGTDYRGTVLSRSQADRMLSTEFGTKYFWRGFQISCYACHNGPNSEASNPNRPAVVSDVSASTMIDTPVLMVLNATDPDGNPLTLRIVSQPSHGTVGLSGTSATYIPETGFSGNDSFTFAAWDGSIDSNLGHGTVSVGGGSSSPSPTATNTPFPTATPSSGAESTATATRTSAAEDTPTSTRGSSLTPTPTVTRQATVTATATFTQRATLTPTRTFTRQPTRTATPVRTATSTRRPTVTLTPTRTRVPTRTPTPSLAGDSSAVQTERGTRSARIRSWWWSRYTR